MNLEGIFGIFSFFDENEPDKKIEQEIEEYTSTPHYKIKIFIKLITNGKAFKQQLIQFFQQSNESLDMSSVDSAGEFMMYSRSWYWINQCDLNNDKWQECLKNIPHKSLFECLDSCIEYYLSLEEYEKCAFLKSIKEFCEKA